MATTLRTVINRVLTALGETTVPAATTDLANGGVLPLKVLEFLNQFKEEIEDANMWRALRQSTTVTVTANTNTVALTGFDERVRVVRAPAVAAGQLAPLVFDITATNNPIQLAEISLSELFYRNMSDAAGTTTVQPDSFAIDISNDVPQLYLYPTPNSNRTIQLHLHQPQRALISTDLDTAGLLLIPMLPLLKGTIWYALLDRGEEMGAGGAFTEERYRSSLDDAVSRDVAEAGNLDQLIPDQVPWDGTQGGGGGVGYQGGGGM